MISHHICKGERLDLLSCQKMNHSSRCSGLIPCRAFPIGRRLSFSRLVMSAAI